MKYDRVQQQWRGNKRNPYYEARRENCQVVKEQLERLIETHADDVRSTDDEKYTKPIPSKDTKHTLYARGIVDKANPENGVFLYDIVVQENGREEIKAQVDIEENSFISYPGHVKETQRGIEDIEVISVLDAMQQYLDSADNRHLANVA